MRFNKLVRDRIPEMMKEKGLTAVTHVASEEEYWKKLKEKLQEEVGEFTKDQSKEELADVLEVVYAIRDHMNMTKDELEEIRQHKFAARGGFKGRLILDGST